MRARLVLDQQPPGGRSAVPGSAAALTAALGLAAGVGLDVVVGDPRRGHPVAAFGALAARLERILHRDSRGAGALHAGLLCTGAAAVGALTRRAAPGPLTRTAVAAVSTWSALGGTTLRREADAMDALLRAGDLAGARERVTHLCGRDPGRLDLGELARATVESVAENTSDAVVAPLLWGAVAGAPGLLAYRALNTLDAMVGHRSARYARFGWAAARADDVANLVPARVTAALTVVLAPVVGGRPRAALRAWRGERGRHPSPNAGPVEAAFAGALGRTLGGRSSYGGRAEERPLLGDGPAPGVDDVARAARLSLAVQLLAAALAVALAPAVAVALPALRAHALRARARLVGTRLVRAGLVVGAGLVVQPATRPGAAGPAAR